MSEAHLKVWVERDGGLLRLRLARPKANIIDAAMIAALDAAFRDERYARARAALLDHEGPHFSFGASVEEHLPANCAAMIAGLHALLVRMLEWPAPVLVAVKGQCLGGGLELALAGSRIFAAPDAQFGQPEIKLAVFAPAASCLLPFRVNQQCAEDLLFSGRSLGADEALRAGLAASVDADPVAAALEYYDKHLAARSAAALRYAVLAARVGYTAEVKRRIAEVERLYLEGLMKTRDANEGLVAFLEKRTPRFEHR
jgi:cyclohexa-1,5-dienecarbonyl-CoA hydratase